MQLTGIVPAPFVPSAREDSLRTQLSAAADLGCRADASWRMDHAAAGDAALTAFAEKRLAPVPTGAALAADLAELHSLEPTRTAAQDQTALWYSEHGHKDVWSAYLQQVEQGLSATQVDRANRVFKRAMGLASLVGDASKAVFVEPHPYVTDPTLHPLRKGSAGDAPDSPNTAPSLPPSESAGSAKLSYSYPSSHATAAFAAAAVLSALAPQRAAEFAATAEQVAFSRLYAGVHYRSDVVAGAWLGALLAADALRG
ncbi:MAG: phosphatase PAP2 family protein [Thermoleophilia bacterium]|nr:phosphatase PAP2 family protein [Thermoleophilia bacterium]